MAGIYVHIPFCRSRCIYCDFFSTTLPPTWQEPYVEAIGRELELRVPKAISSLYIGGGTPSLLAPEVLHRLFSLIERHVPLTPDTEVTIEANPDDVTPTWIETLRETPVNRISMGVQSLDDNILRTLRRRHTADKARQAVSLIQEAGYVNLSLDLIYGLPGQTLQQFSHDVRELLSLGIPHLSAYALQFEPDTPLSQMKERGEVGEADEELSLACYESLLDLTAKAGFEHYEISNFALSGFRSRHNSSYWTGVPYIGLGAGAHSYDGVSTRSYNVEDISRYIQSLSHGTLPSCAEHLSEDELYNERVMLSLRTSEGLSLSSLLRDFGPQRHAYCLRMAQPHILGGRLKKTGETLCLTRSGLFVSDDIISDLMI